MFLNLTHQKRIFSHLIWVLACCLLYLSRTEKSVVFSLYGLLIYFEVKEYTASTNAVGIADFQIKRTH